MADLGEDDPCFFELVGDTVWGATARILYQLLTRRSGPPRPSPDRALDGSLPHADPDVRRRDPRRDRPQGPALAGVARRRDEDSASRAVEAIERASELTKDALAHHRPAAPGPVAQSEVVKALTRMGYEATEHTKRALIDGLDALDELTGAACCKRLATPAARPSTR